MQCAVCDRRYAKSKGLCPHCGHRTAAPRSQLETTLARAATRGQGLQRQPSLPRLKFMEDTDDLV